LPENNYDELLMIRAAITPGTQPIRVNIVVMTIEPQPLSITANGGKMMHNKTRQQLIDFLSFFLHNLIFLV
jgi:hypothetical protein